MGQFKYRLTIQVRTTDPGRLMDTSGCAGSYSTPMLSSAAGWAVPDRLPAACGIHIGAVPVPILVWQAWSAADFHCAGGCSGWCSTAAVEVGRHSSPVSSDPQDTSPASCPPCLYAYHSPAVNASCPSGLEPVCCPADTSPAQVIPVPAVAP